MGFHGPLCLAGLGRVLTEFGEMEQRWFAKPALTYRLGEVAEMVF